MENNQKNVKVSKQTFSKNKVVIWSLSILIAVLLVVNGLLISLAYFTETRSGSSIITFGSVQVNAYALNGTTKENTIKLDSNQLIAGAVTTKNLQIEVAGLNDCYVRLTGEFQIAVDNTNYVAYNDFVSFSIDSSNWKLCEGKYYYTSPLSGTSSANGGSTIYVPVKFTVSENFGNSSLANDIVYKNKPYKIVITIESCQSEGTSIGSGSNFDYTKWVS